MYSQHYELSWQEKGRETTKLGNASFQIASEIHSNVVNQNVVVLDSFLLNANQFKPQA